MTSARIEDVTEFVLDGTHASPIRTETGVPVLSAQNVREGTLNFATDRYTSSDEYEAFKKRLPLQAGDVLLTIVGTIGRAAVLEEARPLVFQRSVAVMRPRPGVLCPRFLYHVSQTRQFQVQLARSANRSSQAGVYLGKLKELRVPIPPLSEQRRIAAILDKANALRTKRRAALTKLDTLTQSIFIEMFGDPANNAKGWPITTIGDLLESASYGTSEKASTSGEFAVLRMNNITPNGEMNFSDLKYMDLAENQRDRYLVRRGDVLFNRTNSAELVGKTAIYRGSVQMAYAGYLIRLRAKPGSEPEYLAAFLNTSYAKRVLRGMCKSIIGMANINATEVQSIRIPKPDVALQRAFAKRVACIEKIKAVARSLTEQHARLFASLQSRAFRGKL